MLISVLSISHIACHSSAPYALMQQAGMQSCIVS